MHKNGVALHPTQVLRNEHRTDYMADIYNAYF